MKRTGAIVIGERDILQAGLVATLDKTRFKVARDLSYGNDLIARRRDTRPNSLYLAIEVSDRPQVAKETISKIRHNDPEACVVLIMTSSDEARWAFEAGADGCLPHTISARALIAALELLVCREVAVGIALTTRPVAGPFPPRPIMMAPEANSLLSQREREVLACVARGESNKRIARALKICEATVKGHVRTVLRKIGASNRTQAAVMANEMLAPLLIGSPVDGHC